jgi:hypothetical protein
LGYDREDGRLGIATVGLGGALFGMGFGVGLPIEIAMLVVLLMGFAKNYKFHCLKADFQSSHEAPRSSLRMLAYY